MAYIKVFLLLLGVTLISGGRRFPRFLGFGSSTSDKVPSPPPVPQYPPAHLFNQRPIVYTVKYIERNPGEGVPGLGQVPTVPVQVPQEESKVKGNERVYLNIYGQSQGSPYSYYDRSTGQVLVPCPYYDHQLVHASPPSSGEVGPKPVVVKNGVQPHKPVVVGSTLPYPYQPGQEYYSPYNNPYYPYVDPYYLLRSIYGPSLSSVHPSRLPGVSSVVQHSVHPPLGHQKAAPTEETKVGDGKVNE